MISNSFVCVSLMQSELWGSLQDNHLDFDNKVHCGTNSYCLINLKHLWVTKIWVHEFCKHNLQNVYCKSPMHSLSKRVFGKLYIVTGKLNSNTSREWPHNATLCSTQPDEICNFKTYKLWPSSRVRFNKDPYFNWKLSYFPTF